MKKYLLGVGRLDHTVPLDGKRGGRKKAKEEKKVDIVRKRYREKITLLKVQNRGGGL